MENEKYSRREFLKTATIFAGLVSLIGVTNCGKSIGHRQDQYNFDGEIDGEKIKYWTLYWWNDFNNCLQIVKKDGTKILYTDSDNDLKVDKLEKVFGVEYNVYINDEVGKPVLEKAQRQFEGYLNKILETKRKKGLESL